MGRNGRRGAKKTDLPQHPLNFFPNKKKEGEVDLLFFTDRNLEIESSCEIIARANKTTHQPVTLYTGRPDQPEFPRGEGQVPLKVNVLAGEKPWLKEASGSHLWRDPKPTRPNTRREEGTANKGRDLATLGDKPLTIPAHQADLTGALTLGYNLAAKMGLPDMPRITPRPTVIHTTKKPPIWPNQRYHNRLGERYQRPDNNTEKEPQAGAGPSPHTSTQPEQEDLPWEAPPNYWHTPVAENPLTPPRTPPHTTQK